MELALLVAKLWQLRNREPYSEAHAKVMPSPEDRPKRLLKLILDFHLSKDRALPVQNTFATRWLPGKSRPF
jgi:hypothetical protein